MIDRRSLSLLFLGGAASLAGCASEEAGPPRHGEEDRMHQEAAEMLFISPMGEPFRAVPPAPYPVNLWFNGADTNHDGKLDLDEFVADAARFFQVLDVNKDGVIDHREIYYYEHKLVPEVLTPGLGRLNPRFAPPRVWLAAELELAQSGLPGDSAPINDNGLGVPQVQNFGDKPLVGAAAFNMLADPEPVQGSDVRLTGEISLVDFKTRAQQRFKLLDDKDRGYLTLAGLPMTQAQQLMPHDRRRGSGRRA